MIQTSASPIDIVRPISRFHAAHPEIEISVVNQPSSEMVDSVVHGVLMSPWSAPAPMNCRTGWKRD